LTLLPKFVRGGVPDRRRSGSHRHRDLQSDIKGVTRICPGSRFGANSQFLRAKAPIRGFLGPSAVGTILRHALLHAGIESPTTGCHQFRHALATQMLRQGASLAEIGGLLGHRSPETTKIYTKVDLEALRTLALPWPGGVR